MRRFTVLLTIIVLHCFCFGNLAFAAKQWPTRPITVYCTFGPGGAADLSMRIIADYASKKGIRINVINMPSGGGATAALKLKSSRADGYNLILTSNSCMIVTPRLKQVGYTIDDFVPVANINNFELTFVTKASDGFTSMEDWFEKAQEGGFTYGSPSPISAQRLMMTYLLNGKFPELKISHVPYSGGHAVNTALLGGQITAGIGVPGTNKSYIDSGDFKLLAVSSPNRLKLWPDVPTIGEIFGEEYTFTSFNGLLAKKGTPPEIVQSISNIVGEALSDPGVIEKLERIGLNPAYQNSEDFSKNISALTTVAEKALNLVN